METGKFRTFEKESYAYIMLQKFKTKILNKNNFDINLEVPEW